MSQEWYYGRNGKQHGPVAASELKRLAASGELQPADFVWKEGMGQWVAAASVKGLVPQGAASRWILPPSQWYYGKAGEQHGPVAEPELKKLAASGRLQPADLVWTRGMDDWAAAGSVKDLFPEATVPEKESLSPPGAASPAARGSWKRLGLPVRIGIVGGGALLLAVSVVIAVWVATRPGRSKDATAGPGPAPASLASVTPDGAPATATPPGAAGPASPGPAVPYAAPSALPVKEGPPVDVSAGRLARDFQLHEKDANAERR